MFLAGNKDSELERLTGRWISNKDYRLPYRTLRECAQRMGTSPELLHRYCLKRYRMDFRTLRRRLRMEDAKAMLLEFPDLPSSTIGRQLGILDRSNFTRQFKEHTGYTPDQWRLLNKK